MPLYRTLFLALVLTIGNWMPVAALELQAHRGGRGLWPENTLPAFAGALSLGVTTLELDTGITKDGKVVVSHNPHLDPGIVRGKDGNWLADKSLTINGLTLDEVKAFDVGRANPASRTAQRFPNQKAFDGTSMPTLDEVFALVEKAGNKSVRFNIETKLNPFQPDLTVSPANFVKTLIAVINKAGMGDRVTIQSFDWRTLKEVQIQAPRIPTVYLSAQQRWLDNVSGKDGKPSPWTDGIDMAKNNNSVPAMVKAAGGTIWSPFFGDIKPEMITEAHDLGLQVVVWTVNKPEHMKGLIAMGVDGIISDYPDILRKVMMELGLAVPAPTPVKP